MQRNKTTYKNGSIEYEDSEAFKNLVETGVPRIIGPNWTQESATAKRTGSLFVEMKKRAENLARRSEKIFLNTAEISVNPSIQELILEGFDVSINFKTSK